MRTGRSRQQNKFSVILVHDDDNRCDIVSYHAEFIYKGVVVATLAPSVYILDLARPCTCVSFHPSLWPPQPNATLVVLTRASFCPWQQDMERQRNEGGCKLQRRQVNAQELQVAMTDGRTHEERGAGAIHGVRARLVSGISINLQNSET